MKRAGESLWVGIDCGSVSINCVVMDENRELVYEIPYERHQGKVEKGVRALIERLYGKFGEKRIVSISFTGNQGRKISEKLSLHYEFETISQAIGSVFMRPDVRSIILMGGQDTALLQICHKDAGISTGRDSWDLEYFNTNGPCASGTGSFIDQQAQRLAISMYSSDMDGSPEHIDNILNDFIRMGFESKRPASVACRCTVFTKSDMIHLQNKGEKLEDIIYGLHVGNARNYISTIVSNRLLEEPVLFVGGLSLNALQVKVFRDYFPGIVVPPFSTSAGAIGVALQALDSGIEGRPSLGTLDAVGPVALSSIPSAPRLDLVHSEFTDDQNVVLGENFKGLVFLGLDIGSTTTKYAVINEDRQILHKAYVPTQGKPIEVTQRLLKGVSERADTGMVMGGIAATGSGRNVVGDFLNADLIIDEITAHAKGAVEIDPWVETIFEIGGQDSKYINISNGYPLDFDMNKVCAAGTGSFLHELAGKYGINIVDEFQSIALSSDRPVKLAERCTVFMESDLVSFHQKGLPLEDLMAGLCYAIVHNYLNRVVGKRSVGKNVMFLGGPSLNKGVVAAFEKVLGCPILLPENREVLGAYGAAVSIMEKMAGDGKRESQFRGLESAVSDRMSYTEKICRADPDCHNRCKLKVYDFDGRKSIWGGECGRYEIGRYGKKMKDDLFSLRQSIWADYMSGFFEDVSSEPVMEVNGRPTVGMQRALYFHETGIMWAHFFDHLGFRLVLTPPTNPEISRTGIETMVAETCYPVKVSHGHVIKLIGKTRHLFLPVIITMPTPKAYETGFYCPLVQSNAYMVCAALGVEPDSVIRPVVHMKYEPERLVAELSGQLQAQMDVGKGRIKRALYHALEIHEDFKEKLWERGRHILESTSRNEPIVVVTGRPYNLYDERLNLRLGRNLAKIGVTAIPMDFLDTSEVDLSDFPSMYWGLGARILRTARFIGEHDNYFGLHLTNFSCGADSFLEHFYKYIMGRKPYLILELDEHSAVAGVMTRLEAFRNVLGNAMQSHMSESSGRLKIAN